MAEVSHTNPETGETFGDSQVFERGKVAVVDGGQADTGPEDDDREDDPMGDVDHTPRHDAPDASEVYDRGVERVDDEGDDDEAEAAHDAKSEPEADV
ncbi:hypothetical protein G9C84_08640 [Halolamina sp. R1-12]|nr:hypothetical protein [Halolamina sp. R1-12]